MTERARGVYLNLGRAFVALGVGVAAFGAADAAFGLGVFRGSPVGTAAFLALVGALLLWTVRQAGPPSPDPQGDDAAPPSPDPEGDDAAPPT